MLRQSTEYLLERNGWWHMHYPIPTQYRHLWLTAKGTQRTHHRKALKTDSLTEANQRKHAEIAGFLRECKRRGKKGAKRAG